MTHPPARLPRIFAIAALAACAGSHGQDKPPPPITTPQPSHSSVAVAPAPEPSASVAPKPETPPAEITAWTDEGAIAALAKDCHWDPDGCLAKLYEGAKTAIEIIPELPKECNARFPLACAHTPGQVCVPDECSQSDYDCIPACDKTCQSCADGCVDACEACKSPCTDDACRLACAKSCASCRQACVTELDHCASGHCSEVADTCFRDRDAQWEKSSCAKVCGKVQQCRERCPPDDSTYNGVFYSTCAQTCFSRYGKGCPTRFDQICLGNYDASVNFNIMHEQIRAEKEGKKPPP